MEHKQKDQLRLTVIVPVHNGAQTLHACLSALFSNRCADSEILVIDDYSTDNSAGIAQEMGATVLRNVRMRGPAGARNEGAIHAKGDILLFIDSDITVQDSTLSEILAHFEKDPELTALFGSYDTSPARPNFLSQYKNLTHHYFHQISRENTSSFWAGCGAIRKNIFMAIDGFNEKEYPNASIEDIELGLRLTKQGHRIKLVKELQVKHHKKWTPLGLLKADIFYRAVPWTRLIAESRKLPDDLNLQRSQRWSAAFAVSLTLTCFLLFIHPWWKPIPLSDLSVAGLLFAFAVIYLNRNLYRFFVNQKGIMFSFLAFFWHFAYYIYSTITFGLLWSYHRLWKGIFHPHPERRTQIAE